MADVNKLQVVFNQFIRILAILFSIAHLYLSTIGSVGTFQFRLLHFIGATVLIYLVVIEKSKSKLAIGTIIFLILLTLVTGGYIGLEHESMIWRVSYPTTLDFIFSIIVFLIVLDITRRTIGWALPIIACVLVIYALLGNYIPGQFGHPGYGFERIFVTNYVTTEGMFGTPLGIMARLIFVFILFGVSLEVSGAGKYFLDLAKAAAGKLAGGPAKMAVIGSALFGSMSGSAVANTVASGSLTIPLMKRTGYKPHVAAGIEAAASTGGQMVPPIMGAAAFLIAEYTGTSYLTVVIASILPAILYFASVYVFVHIEAKKEQIRGLKEEEVPELWKTFKGGYYYFIPLIVIVAMFIMNFSVSLSASVGILVLYIIMLIKDRGKISTILESLEEGAKSAVQISSATICAGVVVGIVGLTGVGLKFSGLIMGLADGKLFLAVILVGFASLILGMGLPVVAAYIILIVVAGAGLEELGLPLLVAHLIVFWFSQLSNITPPVALAAYAGAGIAKSDPMRAGLYASRIAIGLPIIPFLFVYRPMLVGVHDANLLTITITNFMVLMGLIAIIAAFQGYFLKMCNVLERLLLVGFGIGLFINSLILNSIILVLFFILLLYQWNQTRTLASNA